MPLKILLISHKFHPNIGGIETISELLANSFSEAGHKVHVLTWSTDQSKKVFQFEVVRNPNLWKICQEHAWADFVFENNPCIRLSWPSLLYRRPSIIVLQTWLYIQGKRLSLSNRIKYLRLKQTSRVVAISNSVRVDCWPSATIIGNSYNAKDFKIMPDSNRVYDFAFIGRLVSDKGADMAIKAVDILLRQALVSNVKKKEYSLTIIGDGPDRSSLEELVINLGLQEHVRFKGPLRGRELATCLNQHRFLLVPSVWKEPFGIVALEGMACGCLPIVSDGGGLPDAVGNAGITFSRGDVNALVESIMMILNNPELEQKLRNAATKQLMAHHPGIISQKYLDLINLATAN